MQVRRQVIRKKPCAMPLTRWYTPFGLARRLTALRRHNPTAYAILCRVVVGVIQRTRH